VQLYGVKSALAEKLKLRAAHDERQAMQLAERATAFQASFQHLSSACFVPAACHVPAYSGPLAHLCCTWCLLASDEIHGASSERQSQMDGIKAAVSVAQTAPPTTAAPSTNVWEYVLFAQGAIIIAVLAWRSRTTAKHNAKLLGHSD
jgi:hypothetical protein